MRGGGAHVVFVEPAISSFEPIPELLRIREKAYGFTTGEPRTWKVWHECGRGVQGLESEPAVQLDDVSARGEIGEVVARLGEQRTEKPKALMSVVGEHAPCGEVAEGLRVSVDESRGVEREIRTHD
jgi:hypothetical protein